MGPHQVTSDLREPQLLSADAGWRLGGAFLEALISALGPGARPTATTGEGAHLGDLPEVVCWPLQYESQPPGRCNHTTLGSATLQGGPSQVLGVSEAPPSGTKRRDGLCPAEPPPCSGVLQPHSSVNDTGPYSVIL